MQILEPEQVPFGSNEIRLSVREWCVAAAIVVLLLGALPVVWKRWEKFEPGNDYRIPAALSNDYWIYNRLSTAIAERGRIAVIGDSVVWGEYVRPDETLTHYLNRKTGSDRFVNAGLSGTHPLALEGLVRNYAADIADSKVILHVNLLWLGSPERDLSDDSEKEIAFNHPELIPQFRPHIPAYKATRSVKLGVLVDRHLPVRRLARHLRVSCFESLDVHTWSTEHPYENPLGKISLELPQAKAKSPQGDRPITWRQRGIEPQDMIWVAMKDSLQWQAFVRTARLLRTRGNDVLVVIGPFNTHLLTATSKQKFDRLKRRTQEWLGNHGVAYVAPAELPSDEYADASHPLATGYARLAEQIVRSPSFRKWFHSP